MAKKKKTIGGLFKALKKKVGKLISDESAAMKRARGGNNKSSSGKSTSKSSGKSSSNKSTPAVQKYTQRAATARKNTAKKAKSVYKAAGEPFKVHSARNTNKSWSEIQKEKQGKTISGTGTYVKKHTGTYISKNKKTGKKEKTKYTYTDLSASDYNRMTTAAMTGQLNTLLKNNRKLAKKVADKNVDDYAKGKFVSGVLDQMTLGQSVSDNPVYKYSDKQKKIIQSVKSSKSYNAGRIAGGLAEFALGGTGTLGSGLAKQGGKAALKTAAKQGTKSLAKTTAKRVGKEVAADAAVSAPLNTLDALKASYKDGKLDKKSFAKELALNVGGDVVIGGAVSGVTHGLSAKQVTKFNSISKKLNNGKKLTEAEDKFYSKRFNEIADRVKKNAVTEHGNVKMTEDEVANFNRISNKMKNGETLTASERKVYNEIADRGMQARANSSSAKVSKQDLNKAIKIKAKMDAGTQVSEAEKNLYNSIIERSKQQIADRAAEAEKISGNVKGNTELSKSQKPDVVESNAVANTEVNIEPRGRTKEDTEKLNAVNNAESVNVESSKYTDDELRAYIKTQEEKGATTESIYDNLEEMGVEPNQAMRVMDDGYTDDEWAKTANDAVKAEGENTANSTSSTADETADSIENAAAKTENAADEAADWEKTAREAVESEREKARQATPESIKEDSKTDSQKFDEAVNKSDYRRQAEEIMNENPSMGQNAAKQNVLYYTTDEANAMFFEGFDDGLFHKSKKISQADAREKVSAAAEHKTTEELADDFLKMDLTDDPHVFGAYAEKILPELSEKVAAGDRDALELLMKVSDHANSIVSQSASYTNAAKMWVKMTPVGRCKAIVKEVERLNTKYGDRLKKPLELTDEQKSLIFKAQTDEEVLKAVDQIRDELWDEIPSTFWEKVNAVRHLSMLGNVKTNVRNVLGNTAFASVRAMSNGIEQVVTKKLEKTIQKYGGEAVRATHITGDEVRQTKSFVDKQFDLNYNANSNKYKDAFDMSRPENKTVLESKIGSTAEKIVYGALEKGDIVFFKPEYRRSYTRWCKNHDVPLDKLDEMTELERNQANNYAMREAEKATFRETTKASQMLNRLKEKTSTGKGKTAAGTAALRAANAALESQMPFVKTPINVFRQSVDYSPIGLMKSMNEMLTFAKRKDVDALENAIHHLATGLTGSGITVLGAYLYANDIVTVKAGEKSGDAYYDRDMGYQDYSLVIGGKSYTIDWASPMQSSFFMGAQMKKMAEEKGMTGEEFFDATLTLFSPHIDSSFMSSAKDTFETFSDIVSRADDGDGDGIGTAILTTLGGTVPQNFLQTLMPFSQLMSQAAGAGDDYQRDTRSTKEGTLEKSWDSWLKKVENRIPGLRQTLNPKLDRRGNDKKSVTADSNILTKVYNAFVNPSNVKEVTYDDTDKEIIKIYKGITDEDDKKYFFYNFTGNPDYDLTNGKRMTYDEAYTYGKESRKTQNETIQTMINSKSYKNMTNDMKSSEIKSASFIGKATADNKTYGAEYACESLNRDSDKDAYAKYKALKGNASSFIKSYLAKEKVIARSHDTSFYTKALAVVASGDKDGKLASAYEIHDNKIELEKQYLKAGGSLKEYTNAMCNVISSITKSDATTSQANKAIAAADYNINKRTYTAMGLSDEQANGGKWLKSMGYNVKSLVELKNTGELLNYDIGKKQGVIDYIESLGLDNNLEKACLFQYMSTDNNPYGSIPTYKKDSSATTTASGYSGRSYGRSYGRSGGGSGGSSGSSDVGTWEEWVKQYLPSASTTSSSTSSSSSVKSADSYLTDAYRKKQRKLVQESLKSV